MLEHCEMFWRAFREMLRIVSDDGFLVLIAPSAGPIHRHPVDCYRFYPDALPALAADAGCHLVYSAMDERGPWCDVIGIFAKQPRPLLRRPPRLFEPPLPSFPPNDLESESRQGRQPYLDVLADI